jgi:acyl-CoA synthetase (AMP-forming)/AMP-acid ligase II
MVEEFNSRPYKTRRLLPLPPSHVAVVPRAHFSPLRDGTQVFIMRRFELEPFLANIERYSITDLLVVPPMVVAIIMSPIRKKYDLSSIKYSIVGAAPLGKETQAKFQALLRKDVPFTQVLESFRILGSLLLMVSTGMGDD